MPDCTCESPPELAQAGRAATLCHHTPLTTLQDAQTSLAAILDYFEHRIAVEDCFTSPLRDIADRYAVAALGGEEEYQLITETEYLILTSAFLKQLAIGIQALQVSIYVRIGLENPDV